ncbi:MAG: tRNA1(Val) (adenine(37)-N6)-methyltransferase [Candidatus Marinarcus sp.]|uniref:tRNA1(Val) (adenine(37)-N6)-methyltransferase n=1 Tax=Candidatus Marinarcus sp. TaxID=3100987 RepID=UPI003AFFA6FC
MKLVLYQPQNGYCYNSDTHFLYYFICENLKKFKNIQGEILDIGSGSGILGLLLTRDYSRLNLNQCELQKEFQELSLKNAQTNGLSAHLYRGNFLELTFDKEFDMCVSNPPFYHGNVIKSENENLKIARYNDSMPLEAFIKKTNEILNQNGKFFFCYDVKQINDIMLLLNRYKFNIESMQFIYPKRDKDATLVLVYARKNSKSLTKILSPLIVFDNENFTLEVQRIYSKTQTHSIKVEI